MKLLFFLYFEEKLPKKCQKRQFLVTKITDRLYIYVCIVVKSHFLIYFLSKLNYLSSSLNIIISFSPYREKLWQIPQLIPRKSCDNFGTVFFIFSKILFILQLLVVRIKKKLTLIIYHCMQNTGRNTFICLNMCL